MILLALRFCAPKLCTILKQYKINTTSKYIQISNIKLLYSSTNLFISNLKLYKLLYIKALVEFKINVQLLYNSNL